MKLRSSLLPLCAALAAFGCGKPDVSSTALAASPSGAPGGNVAEVHGQPVTAAELDQRARQRLAPLFQQEYDVRRDVLDQIIAERLYDAEARKRGLTVDALLQQEVESKVPAPAEAEARALYDQHKARLGGRTFEEMRPQIDAAIRDRALQQRRDEFRRTLVASAGVKKMLVPPRADVRVPAQALGAGQAAAPVTIVAFSDYECPYCRKAQETIDEVLRRYPKDARVVVREFPLDFHARARPAAVAARCAGEQDRFWPYYRSLMTVAGDLGDADLRARATASELKLDAFNACLASGKFDKDIQASYEEGQALGVQSTPTFFVNGRMLVGAQPVEAFAEIVDEELALAR